MYGIQNSVTPMSQIYTLTTTAALNGEKKNIFFRLNIILGMSYYILKGNNVNGFIWLHFKYRIVSFRMQLAL